MWDGNVPAHSMTWSGSLAVVKQLRLDMVAKIVLDVPKMINPSHSEEPTTSSFFCHQGVTEPDWLQNLVKDLQQGNFPAYRKNKPLSL